MTYQKMKIALSDPFANRTHVANVLHKLGYQFVGDAAVYNNAKAFFTYDNGIIMKTDDTEYFKGHPNEEYVLVGDELKKASEWFVSPATPFKQPATKPSLNYCKGCNPLSCTGCEEAHAHQEKVYAPLPPLARSEHERQRMLTLLDAAMHELKAKRNIPQEWIDEVRDLWDNQQSRIVEEF
jgi:hypothetical protein